MVMDLVSSMERWFSGGRIRSYTFVMERTVQTFGLTSRNTLLGLGLHPVYAHRRTTCRHLLIISPTERDTIQFMQPVTLRHTGLPMLDSFFRLGPRGRLVGDMLVLL